MTRIIVSSVAGDNVVCYLAIRMCGMLSQITPSPAPLIHNVPPQFNPLLMRGNWEVRSRGAPDNKADAFLLRGGRHSLSCKLPRLSEPQCLESLLPCRHCRMRRGQEFCHAARSGSERNGEAPGQNRHLLPNDQGCFSTDITAVKTGLGWPRRSKSSG